MGAVAGGLDAGSRTGGSTKNTAQSKSVPKSGSKLNTYIEKPATIKNVAPIKIEKIAVKENLQVGTLSRGSHAGQGLTVNWDGNKLLQFHPGGGHHGTNSYWKVSSAQNGTIRIFNDK